MQSLDFYIKTFRTLKRGNTEYGLAPHKPIFLLSLIKAFDLDIYTTNKISITPELVGYFKTYWQLLVKTQHKESFVLPFFHLKGEKSKFWKLIAKSGHEFLITSSNSIKSFKALNDALDYAEIEPSLFELLYDKVSRNILTEAILSEYFSENSIKKIEEIKSNYFIEIQTQLFNETPEKYTRKVKNIYKKYSGTEETLELDKYTRSEAFKREVLKAYNYTCSITGLRVDSPLNISMVDACHIVPFGESFDDTISNGITLCPNMHRAFDRGLIAIDENYKVLVSNNFMESYSHYSIKQYAGTEITLPKEKKCWPRQENLKKHMTRFNF